MGGHKRVIRPDTHPEAFVPVPPDGGWGWVVVFAAFFTNLIIDGIYVSFGIMVTDLVDHFNSTVATVMLMGSLLLGVYQIVGPVAAGMVNRFGCRAVGMFGAVLATVSVFISAFMPNIECMIVSYGIFAGMISCIICAIYMQVVLWPFAKGKESILGVLWGEEIVMMPFLFPPVLVFLQRVRVCSSTHVYFT
ncbi:unnamed protein product [Rodentolepis nana]|uniref:MFS domain-containing protein n=1 Tax=Rodentolepis nana TaxID=102285 RepID=A0A0R3TA24_RODNA|nr:unnamed protein product [Rodentolepis nana]